MTEPHGMTSDGDAAPAGSRSPQETVLVTGGSGFLGASAQSVISWVGSSDATLKFYDGLYQLAGFAINLASDGCAQ